MIDPEFLLAKMTDMSLLVSLLLLGAFFLEVLLIVLIVRDLKAKNLAEYWKDRAKELEAELQDTREHYELLLKDAAIKNAIMRGLYDAWQSGKLQKAIKEGYDVEVLADGTIVISKGEEKWNLELWSK